MDALDSDSSKYHNSAFLPIAIGLAGILVGSIALYFSLGDKKPLHTTDSSLFEDRIEGLELRVEALLIENQTLKQGITKIVEQTQQALNQMGKEISTLHQQQAARHGASQVGSSASNHVKPVVSHQAQRTSKTAGTTYEIQPGDTLSKLARRYGVPLTVLMEANPNVNAKHLRVGQKITIPNALSG